MKHILPFFMFLFLLPAVLAQTTGQYEFRKVAAGGGRTPQYVTPTNKGVFGLNASGTPEMFSPATLSGMLGEAINVKVYGATGDARGTSDATTTSGSPTVTSPTMAFTSADIGKVVWVSEAVNGSPHGYKCIVGTVLAVGSATSITVSANATRSVAGTGRIVLGTDDTAACRLAVAAAIADGKEVSIPGGGYIISADLGFGTNSGIDVNGGGTGATTIYLSPNYDWTTLPNNYGALFDGARSVNRLSMEGGNWPFTFEIPATGIVAGEGYTIVTPGTTDFVAIGAANNDPYTVFTATGAGTGTGTVTRAYPTYSVMRSAASATDIAIARFNGFTYGFKCLASGADYEHIHVLDCSYIGIWVGGSAAVISDSYAGNCGYCSLFVASSAGAPNTGTHFTWSGGVVDESTTASAIVDGCANADIAFTNTEFLGPEGGYGCVISNSSTVRFTACNIIPYTTGNRGGLSIDATSTAFLVNSRLSGDGTKFALLNAGSAYDGGGNTIEGTGLSGTALTNGQSSIVTVPNGGMGAGSHTAYALLAGGTTSTGAIQSLAGVGSSGQVLTSNGAGALPTFQTPAAGVTIDSTGITSGTAGRLLFESGTNKVTEDADLSFSTDTLTATKIVGSTNLTIGAGTALTSSGVGGTVFTTTTALGASQLGANTWTGVQTFPAGSVSAPSQTYGDATTGWYRVGANAVGLTTSSKLRWALDGGYMYWLADGSYTGTGVICRVDCSGSYSTFDMGKDRSFGWMNDYTGTAARDVSLNRGGAGILELKNSTNAQTLRVYGTTTGSKYLSLAHDGTNAAITASSGGIAIGTGGAAINKIISTTTTWDPASLASGTSEKKSAVTLTGVAVGDVVTANMTTIVSSDWAIQAAVTAADTVEVKITNNTGGTVDLTSGTLRINCIKF